MILDRRDLWFDRAKTERDDLGRETRMLNEAMKIIQDHQDAINLTGRTPKNDMKQTRTLVTVKPFFVMLLMKCMAREIPPKHGLSPS